MIIIGKDRFGICSDCKAPHQRYRDVEHAHFAAYCHACHAKYMRDNRPRHSELPQEQRVKANARSYANTYQRRGLLTVKDCEVCGNQAEKHHEDYTQPLNVRWLCRPCHLQEHRVAELHPKPATCTD